MGIEAEVLTQDESQEVEQQEEQVGQTEGESQEGEQSQDESEVVVTLGEASPPSEEDEQKQAPQWVKELRKEAREKARRIRELEQQLASKEPVQRAAPVGEKPTLEGCDYDSERFENEYSAWMKRKADAEAEERKKQEAVEAEQKAWESTVEAYTKQKESLKVSDYEDAEEVARNVFSPTQQALLMKCPNDSATLIYALGKNPKKAQELASIKDPVDFVYAVADLKHKELKVTPRKTAPPPERKVTGSAPVSGSVDSKLERLRAEAAKTGDMSKVVAHKKQLAAKRS